MKNRLEEAPINLTPLIDVVFVILIMFIVIAPLLEIDQVELAQSTSSVKDAPKQEHLMIHVLADNTLQFNKQPVSYEQLKILLTQAKRRYPNEHPQIFHDKNATFGTYQLIKGAVESAGYSKMDVFLKPS